MLIVLEGLDGAGTTSQARRLVDDLVASGRPAALTREPSDGPIGKLLRAKLRGEHQLDGAAGAAVGISQSTFSLLFAADRMDHLQREVEPALARGEVVVSDRWYHSSLAYQGTEAERAWIEQLNARARRPDLTLLLRVRAEVAAERRRAAGRIDEIFEDLPMQRRVEAGYDAVMDACRARGERVVVLDGELPIEAVAAAIAAEVATVLPAR
jgi:dTMP kinase